MFSIIIPVYGNAESIPELIQELERISTEVYNKFSLTTEVVFVVDASPDNSLAVLREHLPHAAFQSQLLLHSRNFGAFAAIRTGFEAAKGEYFAAIAADLQEPPDLLVTFLGELMESDCDVVVGTRLRRDDPVSTRIFSSIFWWLYRKLVFREIPRGGVDVFGFNRAFREQILQLKEANSSLVAQVFWLGFRRKEVAYERRKRRYGRSAWSFSKRLTYLLDSVFAFTDLPIRLLTVAGLVGILVSIILGILVLIMSLGGNIAVPGYAATILSIFFFGALNTLGIGLIGSYAWRAYENSKSRPLGIVLYAQQFEKPVNMKPEETDRGAD